MFTYHQKKILVHNKYFLLLLSFISMLILYPLSFGNALAIFFIHSFLIASLLNIVYVLKRHASLFKINLILGLLLIIFSFVIIIYPIYIVNLLRLILLLIFYVMNIGIILSDITHEHYVTRDVVIGALCVYIIIGLLYAVIFNYLEFNYPDSFQFNTKPIESLIQKSYNLGYFSFTTLTTVGFGDIVPRSFPAKTFVVLEQITGVFYLAVLVSRLVVSMKTASEHSVKRG